MKIAFLIGNGFDIGLGLKTGYKDFYDVYLTMDKGNNPLKNEIFENFNLWSDFEEAFGQYAKNFTKENKVEYIRQYEEFSKEFADYINFESQNIICEDEELLNIFCDGLINYRKLLRPADRDVIEDYYQRDRHNEKRISFITFNYTYTVDNIVDGIKDKPILKQNNCVVEKVVHVHGYLDNGMIIGVNDETQIDNEVFAKDDAITDEIVKPRINNNLRMKFNDDAELIINTSNIICVYGMSLGKTDKKWWEHVLNHLIKFDDCYLVIFIHCENYDKTHHFLTIQEEKEYRRKLLNYLTIDEEEKQKVDKKIFFQFNNDFFSLAEV